MENAMIARVWRGRTPASKADAYVEYLRGTGLKEYAATPGNEGVMVLRSISDEEAEFVLISLWESEEAIRRFAGDEFDRAVYYPEDDDYLLEREPNVVHYEVIHASD
jgi:heme-degrading monooxygenase HmoA